MNKGYDVITAMDLCVDLMMQLGAVLPEFGQKEQLVPDFHLEMGGSCSIFACQAAKLGLKTTGIGVLGQDSLGDFMENTLRGAGVDTRYVRRDPSMKTGLGVILCKPDGDRAILTYPGTIEGSKPEEMGEDLLKHCRHLHIGSFYLLKNLQPHFAQYAKTVKAYGGTVSLDTNWDPEEIWDGGIWEVLPYVDIFFPNENEAKLITRTDSVEDALKKLQDKVPMIALKRGEHGAVLYTGGREYRADPLKVSVVDTVGAGDSFDAGFVYGHLSGLDPETALRIGCICGSLNTTQSGGIVGQPVQGELNQYL